MLLEIVKIKKCERPSVNVQDIFELPYIHIENVGLNLYRRRPYCCYFQVDLYFEVNHYILQGGTRQHFVSFVKLCKLANLSQLYSVRHHLNYCTTHRQCLKTINSFNANYSGNELLCASSKQRHSPAK